MPSRPPGRSWPIAQGRTPVASCAGGEIGKGELGLEVLQGVPAPGSSNTDAPLSSRRRGPGE